LVDADEESSLMKIGDEDRWGRGREVCCIPVDFSLGWSALPDVENGLLALPHVFDVNCRIQNVLPMDTFS
jgi:hypothetical protein